MKYFLLFLSLVFLFSCENQPPKDYYTEKSSNPIQIDTTAKKTTKKVIKKSNLLTNQNVKQKLTDFGIKNKEEKILIRTEFGDIKIRLYKKYSFTSRQFSFIGQKKFLIQQFFTELLEIL